MAAEDISRNALDRIGDTKGKLGEVLVQLEQLESSLNRPFAAMGGGLERLGDRISLVFDRISRLNKAIEKDFTSGITQAIRSGGDFSNLFDRLRGTIEDFVIRLGVVNPLFNALYGTSKVELSDTRPSYFASGGILGGILSLFEARAAGGPVRAGVPYLVGERGPELFVPRAAGRITANAALAASAAPVHVTMNIATPDATSFRASQAQIAARMLDGIRLAQRIR